MAKPRTGLLGPAEEAVRTAWIVGVREWETHHTGQLSNYIPGPRLDGGVEPRTDRRHSGDTWVRLIAQARQYGVDAIAAISCLVSWWPRGSLPEPAAVFGGENLFRLNDRIRRRPREIAIALNTQSLLFQIAVDECGVSEPNPAVAQRRAITGPYALSALFRFTAAILYGHQDLAMEIQEAAARQYWTDAAEYDRSWAAVLTPAIRDALKGAPSATRPVG